MAWKNFTQSDLLVSIKKVSNDTYLKIFDSNIYKNEVSPTNYDVLKSEAKLILNNENYNFTTGFQSYEDLNLSNTDRYQFILPYYDFNRQIFEK